MIKPLLRILPSLSGNVKLACSLVDFKQVPEMSSLDQKTWEANIRGARLLPLSSSLWEKYVPATLLSSTWEYDLAKFYSAYSDVFYKTCFDFNKDDMLKIDMHNDQQTRATDFEWGAKRISYQKNGSQFEFFAPLYIDNANDIPAYFLITAKMYSRNPSGKIVYATKKSLRVNIGINGDDKLNYIYRYLNNYCQKIDDNVAFCTPLTKQATFHGIDVRHGGFVSAIDNMMDRIYYRQNTIHNFDATIAGAFERNRIAMKQIIPLCFQFDVNDFLTDAEKIRYKNSRIELSGAYFDNDGNELKKYDFLTDYVEYSEQVLAMNPMTGVLQWTKGLDDNIMDVFFPSLNECRYVNYEFSNKLAPWFCRWKMKSSSDEHPYIVNNSWAFSHNQNSNYKYGQFPSNFSSLKSIARYTQDADEYYYDLMLPLGDLNNRNSGRALYMWAGTDWNPAQKGQYADIINRYKRTLEAFSANWFFTVEGYDESIFNNADIWLDVDNDGIVYYKGILYDLKEIYNIVPDSKKVDKFAVILEPDVDIITTDELNNLYWANETLYRQYVSQISAPNAEANDQLLYASYCGMAVQNIWEDDSFNTGSKLNQDELQFNDIFRKADLSYGIDERELYYIDLMNATYKAEGPELGQASYGKFNTDYYDMNFYVTRNMADHAINIVNSIASVSIPSDRMAYNVLSECVFAYYGDPVKNTTSDILTGYTGYVFIPAYRSDQICYTPMAYTEDFTYRMGISYEIYKNIHNNAILDIPSAYTYNKSKLYDNFSTLGYVHHNSDKPYVMDSINGSFIYNTYTFTYLTTFSSEYAKIDYGSQLYFKHNFIDVHNIPYYDGSFDTASYMTAWVVSMINSGHTAYSVDDLNNKWLKMHWRNMASSHPAAYWAGFTEEWKNTLATSARKSLFGLSYNSMMSEYEFKPVMHNGNEIHSYNVFVERPLMTGHFYGSEIPKSKLALDNDVLWVDPYNFDAIFKNEGYPYHEGEYHYIPKSVIFKDMYVRMLNKTNLFYWYIELHKNANKVNYDNIDESDYLRNKWYNDLYIVEKKLVYDTRLGDEDTNTMPFPQVKLIYTPLERLLGFSEYVDYDNFDDNYRSFTVFYNSLRYDTVNDCFTLPGFFKQISHPHIDEETGETYYTYTSEYAHRYEKLAYSYYGQDEDEKWTVSYDAYEPIKFEIVCRKPMMRVDDDIWKVSHISEETTQYRDIYFFRVQSSLEHDQKYDGVMKTEFFGNMDDASYSGMSGLAYLTQSLAFAYTYTYSDKNNYDRTGFYDTPHSLALVHGLQVSPYTRITSGDTMLIPLFDDIFVQEASFAQIYAHYILHDISVASIIEDTVNEYTGETKVIGHNYRYNKNNKVMMTQVSHDEIKEYGLSRLYTKFDECKSNIEIVSDDLGFGNFRMSTKVMPDGTTYGFYYIKSQISNTSDTFNTDGIINDGSIITPNLRLITHINGHNIIDSPEYITGIFKELLPMIGQKPIDVMSDTNTIIYPNTYPFDLIYSQVPDIKGPTNTTETRIILNKNKLQTTSLLRYFHAMTPLLVPCTELKNEWHLKLKDVDALMLDTGRYLSIGDSCIYSIKDVKISTAPDINVWTMPAEGSTVKPWNNVGWTYKPLENKFYNDSSAVYLEHSFEEKLHGKMTYQKVLSLENDDTIRELFAKHINGSNEFKKKFTDDEILFLLNKYKASFNSVPAGLDMTHSEKLYTLSIVYSLI